MVRCDVCFRVIKYGDSFIHAGTLPRIKNNEGDRVTVHLICWCIRQSIPTDLANESFKFSRADFVTKIANRKTIILSSNENDDDVLTFPHFQCRLCKETNETMRDFIYFGWSCSCDLRVVHLKCAFVSHPVNKRFACPLCVSPTSFGKLIEMWSGVASSASSRPQRHLADNNNNADWAANLNKTISVYDLLNSRSNVDEINAMFEARTAFEYNSGFATPIKELCNFATSEKYVNTSVRSNKDVLTPNRKIQRSLLKFAIDNKYSGAQMAQLGIHPNMLFDNTKDWNLIFDKKTFPVKVLVAPPFNFTFTNLLLAGMSIKSFIDAKYERSELFELKLNKYSFIAGGGTPENWFTLTCQKMVNNDDDDNENEIFDNFVFE